MYRPRKEDSQDACCPHHASVVAAQLTANNGKRRTAGMSSTSGSFIALVRECAAYKVTVDTTVHVRKVTGWSMLLLLNPPRNVSFFH